MAAVGVLCKQNENTALDTVAAAEASPSGPGGEQESLLMRASGCSRRE